MSGSGLVAALLVAGILGEVSIPAMLRTLPSVRARLQPDSLGSHRFRRAR